MAAPVVTDAERASAQRVVRGIVNCDAAGQTIVLLLRKLTAVVATSAADARDTPQTAAALQLVGALNAAFRGLAKAADFNDGAMRRALVRGVLPLATEYAALLVVLRRHLALDGRVDEALRRAEAAMAQVQVPPRRRAANAPDEGATLESLVGSLDQLQDTAADMKEELELQDVLLAHMEALASRVEAKVAASQCGWMHMRNACLCMSITCASAGLVLTIVSWVLSVSHAKA